MKCAEDEFGPISLWINNAGVEFESGLGRPFGKKVCFPSSLSPALSLPLPRVLRVHLLFLLLLLLVLDLLCPAADCNSLLPKPFSC